MSRGKRITNSNTTPKPKPALTLDSYLSAPPNYSGEVIESDGCHCWLKDGKLHREGDKPAVIYEDGDQEWWQNDQLHREGDKPAVIRQDGLRRYAQNNQNHRVHGPAVIQDDVREYWLKDVGLLTQEEWERQRQVFLVQEAVERESMLIPSRHPRPRISPLAK